MAVLVEGASTLDVINPATGRTLIAAPRADRAQIDQAVAAAKTAFPIWSATPLRQRGALLLELAEALEDERGAFARLLTQEQMGPIQNQAQLEKVKGFLEDARQNGKIVAGGGVLERGGYFSSRLSSATSRQRRLIREEQLGPALRYSGIDEVIARANDTDFGLGGSVWSSDKHRAFRVATRINAGTVWVSKHLDLGPGTPYGGAKQSRIGTEQGREGLEEFTQATIINVAK